MTGQNARWFRVVALVALVVGLAGPLRAQSLGEVAERVKAEREKRASDQAKKEAGPETRTGQQVGGPGSATPRKGVPTPATDTVYVTNTGAKYHRAGCSSLRHSSIPMALKDAAVRYQPCKICSPPLLTESATTTTASSPRQPMSSVAPPKTIPVERVVEATRCQATTRKGTQCSRNAKPGTNYCWQHGG